MPNLLGQELLGAFWGKAKGDSWGYFARRPARPRRSSCLLYTYEYGHLEEAKLPPLLSLTRGPTPGFSVREQNVADADGQRGTRYVLNIESG